MRFCGTRGGNSFLAAQRPELSGSSFACPSNFVACSADTSDENTICVASNKKATDCPLTFVKFVRADEYTTTIYPTDDYEAQLVPDENFSDYDHYLVTSTTKGDNLPLTSFKIENKPCLDQNDVSRTSNAKFYPLEHDRENEDCREIDQFSERYDSRYIDLGLKISEYDVQEESGVLGTLRDLPIFSDYVNADHKKNIWYGFWSRPTIPWNLECEETHSRDSVVSAAKNEKDKEPLNDIVIIVLSSVAFGLGFIATITIVVFYICMAFRH